jgi:hypothetical protein
VWISWSALFYGNKGSAYLPCRQSALLGCEYLDEDRPNANDTCNSHHHSLSDSVRYPDPIAPKKPPIEEAVLKAICQM